MVYGVRPGATLLLNPQVQPPAQAVFDPVTRRAVRYVETVVPTVQLGTATDNTYWYPADKYYLPLGRTAGTLPWGTSSGGTRSWQNWDTTEKQYYAIFTYTASPATFHGNGFYFVWPTGPHGESTSYSPKNATVTSISYSTKLKMSANTSLPDEGFGASNGTTFGGTTHEFHVSGSGVGGVWRLWSTDGTTQSSSDGSTACDTGWHEFKFVWTSANIKLYVDGTLEVTKTTNLPTRPLQPLLLTDNVVTTWDIVDIEAEWA